VLERSTLRLSHTIVHPRLALGGGFGFLSGEHGLTVDNIVQVGDVGKISTFTFLNVYFRSL
jgi:hypothetical protein